MAGSLLPCPVVSTLQLGICCPVKLHMTGAHSWDYPPCDRYIITPEKRDLSLPRRCSIMKPFQFLLLFILALVPVVAQNSSYSTQTQLNLDVLLHFKNSITLDPHQSLQTWNATTHPDPCSWFGILCIRNTSQIRNISLPNLGLGGSITPKIINLHGLSFLDLSSNNLSGSIPAFNGGISHLNLSYNALSGNISTQFEGLSKLRYVSIRNNDVEGSMDGISGCISLEELDLSNNKITGRFPWSIQNLTNIRIMRLEECFLDGPIPASLGNCSQLERIYMSHANLQGSLPGSLINCKNLRTLSFWYCGLSGAFPAELASLSAIRTLNLEGNNFTGPIFSIISNFSLLSILDLNENSFTDTLPANLGGMFPSLWKFFIQNNNFSGRFPSSLGICSNLTKIVMSWNNLSGPLPLELYRLTNLDYLAVQFTGLSGKIAPQIGNLSQLTTVLLNNNQFEGSIPKEFGMLSKLNRVALNDNFFSGEIPSEFADCRQLISAEFSRNSFDGDFPSSFGRLPNLEEIFAAHNRLTGSIPPALSNASRLRTISLSNNSFTGQIPRSFSSLGMLQNFLISHNHLSGSIPPIFQNMIQLLILDLSFNNFSGSIQHDLSNSVALTYANLSHNNLTGQIPNSLINRLAALITLNLSTNSISGGLDQAWDKLQALKELDLSLNDLTGEIPSSMSKINGLVFANFSYNKLNGRIPSGGVFSRLTVESYLGNPNLCGELCYSYSIINNQSRCSNTVQKKCKRKHGLLSKKAKIALIMTSGILCICFMVCAFVIRKIMHDRKLKSSDDWQINSCDVGAQFIKLSMKEIEEATQNFSDENKIGSGGTGTVYRGKTKQGQILAFKRLNLESAAEKSFAAELQSLRMVRHRNIAKILGYLSNLEAQILILEYMPNGSLDHLLHPKCDLSWNLRLKIADGIAQGLLYLHSGCPTPVIHLDLKPSNILLDAEMEPHITDFGMSRLTTNTVTTQNLKGSFGYFAPEYAAWGNLSSKCDVYSYGVMVMELVSGRRPTEEIGFGLEEPSLAGWVKSMFSCGKISEIIDGRLKDEFRQIESEIKALIGIALCCTQDHPKDRPSMQQVSAMIDYSLKSAKTFPSTDQILNDDRIYGFPHYHANGQTGSTT